MDEENCKVPRRDRGWEILKIFFLVHDDYAAGGLQRSTAAAADCLNAGGHDVIVYCVKTLPGGLADKRVDFRAVTRLEATKLLFWIYFLWSLRRLIRRDKPNVCIGMGLSTSILLYLVTRGMKSPFLIGSERAFPPATPAAWHWKLLRRPAFRKLDRIVCQTQQTARWFECSMGVAPERLKVIPNIVAPASTAIPPPPEAIAGWARHPIIAGVGRLERQKGFDIALQIFARIGPAAPDARFLLIGEGQEEAALKRQAVDLGLGDRIVFLPSLPTLAGLWPHLAVFLLTSRFEGIPNVLAEAMANGVASVAFDCPTGPSELIEDGSNGFLVPLGDVAIATTRCLDLLGDPILMQRIGHAGRALPERFSRDRICALWNALVDRR